MARSVRKSEDGRLEWGRFNWGDWENDPGLSLCSLAAQGLWIRLLCMMAKEGGYLIVAGKSPSVAQLARLVRAELGEVETLLAELEAADVFSRAGWRGCEAVIYSRRMVRENRLHAKARENGKLGGNPNLRKRSENPEEVKAESESESELEKEEHESAPEGEGDRSETGRETDGRKQDGGKTDGRKPDTPQGKVPDDLRRIEDDGKRAWAVCLRFLELRRVTSSAARSFVGKLQRDFGLTPDELEEVGAAAWRTNPNDVRPFMVATARAVVERRRENDVDPEVERAWLREFRERPASWRGDRGPRPGSPGCKVRPAILREFGFDVVPVVIEGGGR